MRSSVLKYLLAAVVVLVLGTFDGVPQTRAQDSSEPAPNPVPLFWRLGKPDPAPDLSLFPKLRVITGEDYPPFHFRDAGGQLTGFDVELIRGICSTLRLNCEISTGPFDNILQALEEDLVDIAAASVARSATNLRRVDLTKPYFRSPAVFAVRLQNSIGEAIPKALAGRRLSVLKGTGHEQFLKTYFTRSSIRPYDNIRQATEALRVGNVDALFADSVSLMYWTTGATSRACCRLAKGAYWESYYFGNGSSFAVKQGNRPLKRILHYGMDRIKESGLYDQIYRKYFPILVE